MSTVRYLEIRPGEGGDDAARFADELLAALTAYARRLGVDHELVRRDRTAVLTLRADRDLGLERLAGVHRVQRIPVNDRAGRRHTSTATLTVLEYLPRHPITIRDHELRVDNYRDSGPGGQHRNTTDSAVRLTHLPTGLVVTCASSRRQHQNLALARERLATLLEQRLDRDLAARAQRTRRDQVAGPERAAKSWTWNDQRSRVTEHESGRTYDMAALLRGRFDVILG